MFYEMLFMFLGFLAVASVSVAVLIRQERNARVLRDEHAEMKLLISSLESRLAILENPELAAQRRKGKDIIEESDSLQRLSFTKPKQKEPTPVSDPLDIHLD